MARAKKPWHITKLNPPEILFSTGEKNLVTFKHLGKKLICAKKVT
jgi:hypothetical protein